MFFFSIGASTCPNKALVGYWSLVFQLGDVLAENAD